jgi:hypothetical protein
MPTALKAFFMVSHPALTRFGKTVSMLWGYFPLTGPGLVLVFLTFLVRSYYVRSHNDLVLMVVTGGVFVIFSLNFIQLALCSLWLWRDIRQGTPQRILGSTRESFATGFAVTKPFFCPSIMARVEWQAPAQANVHLTQRGRRFFETAIFTRRLRAHSVARVVIFSDAFGLLKLRIPFVSAHDVRVVPNPIGIPAYDVLRLFAAGEDLSHPEGQAIGDLIEMKPYVPGDPVKRILWKTYARNRKLLVRQPETAIAQRKKTFAYLVTGQQDEPSAETAWQAIGRGLLGEDFVFAADGIARAVTDREAALDVVVASAQATCTGDGLTAFFASNPDAGRANCVVFAPPENGEWVNHLVNLPMRLRGTMRVLVSVGVLKPRSKSSSLVRWLLREETGFFDESDSVARKLGRAGLEVYLVDAKTGRLIPFAQNGQMAA